jgi:hypothetical protein
MVASEVTAGRWPNWSTPNNLAKEGLRVPSQSDVTSEQEAASGIAAAVADYADKMRNNLLAPYGLTTETATASDLRAINTALSITGVRFRGDQVSQVSNKTVALMVGEGLLEAQARSIDEDRVKAIDPDTIRSSRGGKRSR